MTTSPAPRRTVLLGITLAATLVAWSAAGLAQQRTIGASGAEQLTLDFMAVEKDSGNPVLDLKAEDLVLKVGGKNRVINSLQLVKLESRPQAPADAAPAGPALAPPFGTNVAAAAGPGRNIFIVIDTESLRSGEEPPVRAALTSMISKLSATDQVALVAIPHGGVNVELTSDFNRVRQGVAQLTGAAPANETLVDATDRSRLDVERLNGILRALAGSDHPSIIVYMGSSMVGPEGSTTITNAGGGTGSIGSTNVLGQGELTPDEFNRVREIAGVARATIYVVETEGGAKIAITSSAASRGNGDTSRGLQDIAGAAGGKFYSHVGLGAEDALTNIARETSAYYVATFDADASDKLNTRYPIALAFKTSRPNVQFRVRGDFERTKAVNAPGKAPSTSDMLKTSDPFRDLGLRAMGYVVRPQGPDKDKFVWVKAMAELAAPGTKLTAASAALYDPNGKLVAKFDLPAADLAKPLVAVLQAPAGKYRLRFAVTDGKQSGAADYQIDANYTPAGPLKLSGMGIAPKLLFDKDTPAAIIYFEIYGGAPGQQMDAFSIELVNGKTVTPLEPKPSAVAGEADKFVVTATVPLADLPPGDYQVRATIAAKDSPPGTISATIRKGQ